MRTEHPELEPFLAWAGSLRPDTWGRVPIGQRDEHAAWDNRRFIREMMERNSDWQEKMQEWIDAPAKAFKKGEGGCLLDAPARKRYNLIAWIEEQWHACVDWHGERERKRRRPWKAADLRSALPGQDNPSPPAEEITTMEDISAAVSEFRRNLRK